MEAFIAGFFFENSVEGVTIKLKFKVKSKSNSKLKKIPRVNVPRYSTSDKGFQGGCEAWEDGRRGGRVDRHSVLLAEYHTMTVCRCFAGFFWHANATGTRVKVRIFVNFPVIFRCFTSKKM